MRSFFIFSFYILIAFLFAFPEKHFLSFSIFGIANLNITEFCSLLIPISYFLIPSKKSKTPDHLKNLIAVFIVYFFLTSFFKATLISGSLVHIIHEYRISMVFFAALVVLYMGQKIESKYFVFLFSFFLLISYSISLLGFVFDVDFTPRSVRYDDMEYSTLRNGRVINGNKDFAIFGIYFLFTKKHLVRFVQPKFLSFIAVVSSVSIIIAVLNFDRTLFALMLLEVLLLGFNLKQNFFKFLAKVLLFVVCIFVIGLYIYDTNDEVKRQVDRRILNIVLSDNVSNNLSNNVWEGNRDFMLSGAFETFLRHLLFGTNYNDPLFYYPDGTAAMQTDVTIVNVLARNGIIGLILYIMIFVGLMNTIKRRKKLSTGFELYVLNLLSIVIPLFLLYSLNHDTIYRGSLIIVIALLFTFTSKRRQGIHVQRYAHIPNERAI